MRKLLLFINILLLSIVSYAQSNSFNNAFEACKLARTSISFGEGGKEEIKKAAKLLMKAGCNYLPLQTVNTKHEVPFKDNLVFSPEFLTNYAKDSTLKQLAEKYAKEQNAIQRGGNVQMCTKCIKGKGKVEYSLRHQGGDFFVAAVAEPNGLINLSVIVKDEKGNKKTYKQRSNEFKGMPYRKLDSIPIPQNGSVFITIENKSKENRSVAIIVE